MSSPSRLGPVRAPSQGRVGTATRRVPRGQPGASVPAAVPGGSRPPARSARPESGAFPCPAISSVVGAGLGDADSGRLSAVSVQVRPSRVGGGYAGRCSRLRLPSRRPLSCHCPRGSRSRLPTFTPGAAQSARGRSRPVSDGRGRPCSCSPSAARSLGHVCSTPRVLPSRVLRENRDTRGAQLCCAPFLPRPASQQGVKSALPRGAAQGVSSGPSVGE